MLIRLQTAAELVDDLWTVWLWRLSIRIPLSGQGLACGLGRGHLVVAARESRGVTSKTTSKYKRPTMGRTG